MRLIDADALIEATQHGCVIRRKDVEDAPTVEIEDIPHGEWLAHPWDYDWKVCSVCGQGCEMIRHVDGGDTKYFYRYCPWCGARMVGDT